MAIREVRGSGHLRTRKTLATVMAAALTLVLSAAAHAATITVNSLADTGAPGICVLRDAITAANAKTPTNGCAAGTGHDSIIFSVIGTNHAGHYTAANY
jgi:CSLREA domain-containing protein